MKTINLDNKYLEELKNLIVKFFDNKDGDVKILLFGSRARKDNYKGSDVDIGIEFKTDSENMNKNITLLKEEVSNSNIPYKVDIVNLNKADKKFVKEIMKDSKLWKD